MQVTKPARDAVVNFKSIRQKFKFFCKKDEGATAVEFALVALPFFGLVFAILELAIFFFASRYLENAVFDNLGRKILTQRVDAANACSAIQTEIASMFGSWLDPSKVVITLSAPSSFASGGGVVALGGGACNGLVTPGQIVVLSASYPYPFTGFRFIAGATALGKDMQLTARTAFRIEP
jgi:Flp pilus assembly protein TadG